MPGREIKLSKKRMELFRDKICKKMLKKYGDETRLEKDAW